jgi:hypothetical protein
MFIFSPLCSQRTETELRAKFVKPLTSVKKENIRTILELETYRTNSSVAFSQPHPIKYISVYKYHQITQPTQIHLSLQISSKY